MAIPIRISRKTEAPKWRGCLYVTFGASVVLACVWGLATRDAGETLLAAVLPFALAATCLFISLVWALVMIPLLSLVARLFRGPARNKQLGRRARLIALGSARVPASGRQRKNKLV